MVLVAYKPINTIVLARLIVMSMHFPSLRRVDLTETLEREACARRACSDARSVVLARMIAVLTHFDCSPLQLRPQFPNGIVSSVSFVSTTNTARSLAGFVSLALALTLWRSPGSSEKLCPAS